LNLKALIDQDSNTNAPQNSSNTFLEDAKLSFFRTGCKIFEHIAKTLK